MKGRNASRGGPDVPHDAKKQPKGSTKKTKPASNDRVTIIPDSDAGLRLLDVLERIANETGAIENDSEKSL